jgi:hypothetical protein
METFGGAAPLTRWGVNKNDEEKKKDEEDEAW